MNIFMTLSLLEYVPKSKVIYNFLLPRYFDSKLLRSPKLLEPAMDKINDNEQPF